ncbi:nucleoside recognition domain-containing protein [Saccharospirillum salsuginis]|uniref:Nucleoside transporter/FeoB GTPase Gate domain-containing protein n=1 Tax=Saccharospirillum salsuginis TaxID=418750 RepID=A0A918K3L2_9GAMM|nr:nucleoside recognition domain-containing protein [Saccharospirillum salsuginis]GGX47738.1 hypothetical protein GCM10007392_13250 [Saccharospirillum salsuginis]
MIAQLRTLLQESGQVYWTLLKIMVPALIIVKILESLGATQWLGHVLAPVMGALGLPEGFSVVWAATLLTNIYTGMAVFIDIADQPLTVAQVSVLGALMVVGHSLPIEGAVAKKAGVPWWLTLVLRIGGGLLLGWLMHRLYQQGDWLQQANHLAWQPERTSPGLVAWAWLQIRTLAVIYFIILALMALLVVLRYLGIERLMHAILAPPLRLIGIGRDASNTTIIGLTLGLSFGAGLLIRDAQSGRLSARDAYLTLCLLGLCHSLIEDTLLVMLLGAHLSAVLWGRLLFSLVLMGILARLPRLPDLPKNDNFESD